MDGPFFCTVVLKTKLYVNVDSKRISEMGHFFSMGQRVNSGAYAVLKTSGSFSFCIRANTMIAGFAVKSPNNQEYNQDYSLNKPKKY
jgi:hypothetical protein